MKIVTFITFCLLSLPLTADVNLPKGPKFFPTENLIKTLKLPGGEVRILSSAKDFEALKKELEKILGEEWKPEEAKEATEAEKKAQGIAKGKLVKYGHPDNPKAKVVLSLTELPGLKAGEFKVFLTIARAQKK